MQPYRDTIRAIIETVRTNVAKSNPINDSNGCIRILFRPLCEKADEWSGGLGWSEDDVHEYETTATLAPRGSHTILKDGNRINTYGTTALTLAGCSYNRANHGIRLSYSTQAGANPSIKPENGFDNRRGCACYTICHTISIDERNPLTGEISIKRREYYWGRIYIAVSGCNTDEDNERAACSAFNLLQKIFHGNNYRII